MESSSYRLEECFKCVWLKGEMSLSIVGILLGLSEGSSCYASYIYLRQTVGGTSEERYSGDKELIIL